MATARGCFSAAVQPVTKASQLCMKAGAQAKLQALTSLVANVAEGAAAPDTAAAAHTALTAAAGGAPPVSAEDAGRLLALEQRNAYGIMAPSGDEVSSARSPCDAIRTTAAASASHK